MDLLGSLISSMDTPPSSSLSEEQKKRLKEQKRNQQKIKREQDQQIFDFRHKMKEKIAAFSKDQSLEKLTMSPMTDVFRALLHQIVEDAGLLAYSLGVEGVDRHLVIWKKEFTPCEDELMVLRSGEEWNIEKADQIKSIREARELEASHPVSQVFPKSDYHSKYTHIIDLDVGRNAAQDVAAKSQYGNVQLKHKTDKRTIEQTLAERKIKKIKVDEPITTVTVNGSDTHEHNNSLHSTSQDDASPQ